MRLLFVGPLWIGSTALQRLRGFQCHDGIEVCAVDCFQPPDRLPLYYRIRHRLGWPADRSGVNRRILEAVEAFRPDAVFIDSVKVITPATLGLVRRSVSLALIFYSPDDVSARHNTSQYLERSTREWDVFFTTKTFNVCELKARGARRPVLIGNAFDPEVHRPMSIAEVGPDFERFDAVFVGTCEDERLRSLNFIAHAGVKVVVFGNGWERRKLHPRIVLRDAVYDLDYTRALHMGRVSLCFLRKLNRDRVTTRSVEIPAAGRAMIAERTDEHDGMFTGGREYLSFTNDAELLSAVTQLLTDSAMRASIADGGLQRCLTSGYSTTSRAAEMLRTIEDVRRGCV